MMANCKLQIANCKLQIANCIDAWPCCMAAHQTCLRQAWAWHRHALVVLSALVLFCHFLHRHLRDRARRWARCARGSRNSKAAISRPRPRRFPRPRTRCPTNCRSPLIAVALMRPRANTIRPSSSFKKRPPRPDHNLAALAHYNLGSVAVARAKAKLGEKPEEAEGDARTAALEFLAQAAKHYRDCLSIDAGQLRRPI